MAKSSRTKTRQGKLVSSPLESPATNTTLHEDSQDKPTMREMWNLLQNMNDKLEGLVEDNKNLTSELSEIKESYSFNDSRLKEVMEKLDKLSGEVTQHASKHDTFKRDLQRLSDQVVSNQQRVDELEQYSRKNSVEIHGVPVHEGESCEEIVLAIASKVNVQIGSTDVEITHRLKRRPVNGSTPIVVKFVSHKKKKELLQARRKLKDFKVGELFPSLPNNTNNRVFINENLTYLRRSLFMKLVHLRKSNQIHSTWTIDGKILVKVTDKDLPVLIRNETDIANIQAQHS